MNAEYSSHEQLKTEYINKIKSSQRAWINFRDKNCEAQSFQIEPGTQAYDTSINHCQNKMTQERIKDLVSIQNQ
ncbi:lysozyme inhibitor LprI family protein [Rahnella contaminans]|uniref:lysozyme inhibitor LprI family protein n=1 Tax=Rahnella contaminans TaxID=2703882 RepID=UPI003CC6122E